MVYLQCKCQLDKNEFAALRKNQPPFHERRKHPASATETLKKRGNVNQNTPQKRAGEGQVTYSAENQTSENFLSCNMRNHMKRRTFATTSEKHGEQDWIFLHYERNNNMIKSRWPLYQFVLTKFFVHCQAKNLSDWRTIRTFHDFPRKIKEILV